MVFPFYPSSHKYLREILTFNGSTPLPGRQRHSPPSPDRLLSSSLLLLLHRKPAGPLLSPRTVASTNRAKLLTSVFHVFTPLFPTPRSWRFSDEAFGLMSGPMSACLLCSLFMTVSVAPVSHLWHSSNGLCDTPSVLLNVVSPQDPMIHNFSLAPCP